MKSFFEEYGFVMLSAIVVITLIAIAGSLRTNVQAGVEEVMTGFRNQIFEEGNLHID